MTLTQRLGRAGIELTQRAAQRIHGAASLRPRKGFRESTVETTEQTTTRLNGILEKAERSLTDNILLFWVRHARDRQHGGFITHLDRTGRPFATDKYLVMQARTIWTLAAAHRYGLNNCGYLDLARRGIDFLVNAMWDRRHDGFVWTVDREGQLLDDRKILYGQAFAIYALAEYAIAASDGWALRWAETTFDVIQQRASDGEWGFGERFARDWTPAADTGRRKTANAHLHLMEAVSTLVEASPNATSAGVLGQLVTIMLTAAIHPRHRCLGEDFDREWRPHTTWRRPVSISYGHAVEAAWLTVRALDVLGLDREPWRDRIVGLIDHALDFGFDHVRGGLARYGPPAGDVRYAFYLGGDRLTKRWWEQAEMLVASIAAYSWTRNTAYLAAFEKQFDWIWRHQIDHECGEWFGSTSWRDGTPLQVHKGDDWKCPYHTARALMEVSQRLRALLGTSEPGVRRVGVNGQQGTSEQLSL